MASLLGSKCETCKLSISEIHQVIKCVKCLKIYHPRCRGISAKDRQEIQKLSTVWHCCQTSATPTTPKHNTANSQSATTTVDGFQRLEELMIDMKISLLNQLSELRDKITSLAQENTNLKLEVLAAQEANVKLQDSVSKLEAEVVYLQEKENDNNLVISGIPNRTQNPLTVTLNILKVINSHVTPEHINSAQYIGKALTQSEHNNTTLNTPQNFILVKLMSNRAKQEILQKKKEFKNLFSDQIGYSKDTVKPIFLRDHLTIRQLELFRAVRQFKVANEFQFLWTTNNRILLRKTPQSGIIRIKSFIDLEKLKH